MIYLVFGLILLGVVAYVASRFGSRSRKGSAQGEAATPNLRDVQNMECCGQHETCEKESLLAAISKQIEYYDDEELDRFRGRESGDYLPEEADEFREVLYTMRDDEVAGWVRSLQLRAVELPDAVKDEVFLIVGERRVAPTP